MYVNSLFAFYSWIELGSPLVGESAPPAMRAVLVWSAAVRGRAEQLLVEVLSFARPNASNELLGGGRQRVARELEVARRLHYGAQDGNAEPHGAERVDLSAIDLPEVAGTSEICVEVFCQANFLNTLMSRPWRSNRTSGETCLSLVTVYRPRARRNFRTPWSVSVWVRSAWRTNYSQI